MNENVGKPRERVYRKKKMKVVIDGEIDAQKGRHAFNKQVLSTQKSSKGYSMRPPAQLPERLLKVMQMSGYPGPDKSTGKSTFGKQLGSTKRSSHGYSFGPGLK
jgi:predicted Zn-dependent peptidase